MSCEKKGRKENSRYELTGSLSVYIRDAQITALCLHEFLNENMEKRKGGKPSILSIADDMPDMRKVVACSGYCQLHVQADIINIIIMWGNGEWEIEIKCFERGKKRRFVHCYDCDTILLIV